MSITVMDLVINLNNSFLMSSTLALLFLIGVVSSSPLTKPNQATILVNQTTCAATSLSLFTQPMTTINNCSKSPYCIYPDPLLARSYRANCMKPKSQIFQVILDPHTTSYHLKKAVLLLDSNQTLINSNLLSCGTHQFQIMLPCSYALDHYTFLIYLLNHDEIVNCYHLYVNSLLVPESPTPCPRLS